MKKVIAFVLLSVVMFSCKKEEKSEITSETISFMIEGMTCEVGCKGLLEKKITAIDGVSAVSIDFESTEAQVTFDVSKTSSDKIIEVVTTAAERIYKVSGLKTGVEACAKKEACDKDKKCCDKKDACCSKEGKESCSKDKKSCSKKSAESEK